MQQGELIHATTWARQALAWLPEEELLDGQVSLAQKTFEEGCKLDVKTSVEASEVARLLQLL